MQCAKSSLAKDMITILFTVDPESSVVYHGARSPPEGAADTQFWGPNLVSTGHALPLCVSVAFV